MLPDTFVEGQTDPTIRLMAYINLVRRLMDEIWRDTNLAPIIIACIRGLRLFPEYKYASVLLLDEIEVTGKSNFDQLLKAELKALENYLLELTDD